MIEFTEFTEKLNSSELVSKAWDEIDRDQANAGLLIDTISNEFKDWQPPKPLVVVPQIVADYIETQKNNDYDRVGTLVYGHYKAVNGDEEYYEFNEWIACNFDTFLEAIVNGYTVEKEKMFYLKNVMTNNYLMQHKIDFRFGESDSKEDSPQWQTKFNQSEIDGMETGSYERIEVEP